MDYIKRVTCFNCGATDICFVCGDCIAANAQTKDPGIMCVSWGLRALSMHYYEPSFGNFGVGYNGSFLFEVKFDSKDRCSNAIYGTLTTLGWELYSGVWSYTTEEDNKDE